MDKQTAKHIRMTQEPVGVLICQLAIPCIISTMITAIYNTADTFFVVLQELKIPRFPPSDTKTPSCSV